MNNTKAAEAMLREELDDAGDYAEQMRIRAGYQAGLKRAAEIAMRKMVEYALLENEPTVFSPEFKVKAETAEEIQNLIMKEADCSTDAPSSSGSPSSSASKKEGPSGKKALK